MAVLFTQQRISELFTEILQGDLIKEKENDHGYKFWDMLLDAARQGHETIVRYTYSREDVFCHNCWYWEDAIIAAAKGGHMNVLRFLLTHFTDFMSLNNVQALLWAGVNKGHLAVVNLALETSLPDINRPLGVSDQASIRVGTVLRAAILHGYDDVVRRFIQAGAIQTYGEGFGGISAATVKGRINILAMLWDAGAREEVMVDESRKRFWNWS